MDKIQNENFLNEVREESENPIKHREKFTKSDPFPNEIVRVENLCIENDSHHPNNIVQEKTNPIDENIIKSQGEILQDKNQELYFIHSVNINSVDDHVINENIMFSNTYDYDSNRQEINKKPDFIISPPNELSRQETLSKINIVVNPENINPKEDELIDIENEEVNLPDYRENEKNDGLNRMYEVIERGFSRNLVLNKDEFYRVFKENVKKKIVYLEDIWIDDTAHLDRGINSFILNRLFADFQNKVFKSITQKQLHNYFKKKYEKFIRYRYYKLKNGIFENLMIFTKKRLNWLKHVQKDIKKPTIWLELIII